MTIKHTRPIEILLVEDSEADAFITMQAFKDTKIVNNIHRAKDGEEALAMLQKKAPFEDSLTPDLILLDINLPKISGKEVLSQIKHDDALKRIPVIALTGSQSDNDVIEMYDLQVNSYVTKPVDGQQFKEVVSAIEDFWFTIVVLPTEVSKG